MAQDILRSIVGRLFGLDVNSNLVVGGTKIYYGHNTNLDGVIDLPTISAGGGGIFAPSVTATLATSQNNYSPTGYVGGVTKRLLLAVAAGGSTITGLSATGVPDGMSVLIRNTSTTDSISFSHLSGSSTAGNKFSCANGVAATLAPLAGAYANYVSNVWVFA